MRWTTPRRSVVALAALLAIGNAAAVRGNASADAATSWVDAHPGEAVTDVRARLGDPLRSELADGIYASRYVIAGLTAYAVLYEKDGRVVEIRAFARQPDQPVPAVADPFHVALGDDYDTLKAKRGTPTRNVTEQRNYTAAYENQDGTRSLYQLADDKIVTIELLMTLEDIAKLPSPAPVVEHSGDSIAQAVLDIQPTDTTTVDWEYFYLAYHPCEGDERWKVVKQALQHKNDRVYDILEVTCPSSGANRSLIFDITAGFGKS